MLRSKRSYPTSNNTGSAAIYKINMRMGFTLCNHRRTVWFRRHWMSLPILIRISILFVLMVLLLIRQKSQWFLITRLLPVNIEEQVEEVTHPIQKQKYSTFADQMDSTTLVTSTTHDNNSSDVPVSLDTGNGSNGDISVPPYATAAMLQVSPFPLVYHFPNRPIHDNISSILRQSIGTTVLRHPKKNPLLSCAPTVQFQLRASYHAINRNHNHINALEYTIQSMMMIKKKQSTNNITTTKQSMSIIPKRRGGDELYIEWVSLEDPTDMGIAHITDVQNGTYRLKFIRPPLLQQQYNNDTTNNNNNSHQQHHHPPNDNTDDGATTVSYGRLTIYYDYTCDIGRMFSPKKNQFRRAGEIHVSIHQTNIPRPYIHDFIPPNLGNNNKDNIIDLSKYDTVIAFGDSLMLQLVRRYNLGGFWSPNIHYEENINQCLSNSNDTKTAIEKFQQWHGPQIIEAATDSRHNQSIAVIIGSAVWDAMRGCVRSDLKDHIQAIRQFVTTLRKLYPHIHKIHHSWNHTVLISNEYSHPFEYIIANVYNIYIASSSNFNIIYSYLLQWDQKF